MSSANRGECVTTGGLYRPTHLCKAHFELHKFSDSFFCNVVRLGGVWVWGGVMVHVSGGRGFDLSSGLSQPGGKSC